MHQLKKEILWKKYLHVRICAELKDVASLHVGISMAPEMATCYAALRILGRVSLLSIRNTIKKTKKKKCDLCGNIPNKCLFFFNTL